LQGLALSPENGNLPIGIGKNAHREIQVLAMPKSGLKLRFDAILERRQIC
jgi:hypothetical protein